MRTQRFFAFTCGLMALLSLCAKGCLAQTNLFFSYSDGANIAHGLVPSTLISTGAYVTSQGTLYVTGGINQGVYTLYADPSAPTPANSPNYNLPPPNYWFVYDDVLYFPDQDPVLDEYGLLFTGNGLEINIWGTAPGTYSFYSSDGQQMYAQSDNGSLLLWNTSNGVDLSNASGVPSDAWWHLVSDAGINWIVVDAWGGGANPQQGKLAAKQLQAAIDSPYGSFYLGAYCQIKFNSPWSASQQVNGAVARIAQQLSELTFLAVAIDDQPSFYGKESPAQRVWMVKEAVDAVVGAGRTPILYYDPDVLSTYIDNTDAFAYLPWWAVTYGQDPTLDGEFGNQYDRGSDNNTGVNLGQVLGELHPVDFDTFDRSSLIVGTEPVDPPFRVTSALKRQTTGKKQLVTTVTFTNTGTTKAYYPRITSASLSGVTTLTSLPAYYPHAIPPGGSLSLSFAFPGASGTQFTLQIQGALLFGEQINYSAHLSPH